MWFIRMVVAVLKKHIGKNYIVVCINNKSIYLDRVQKYKLHFKVIMGTLQNYNIKIIDVK
jgi:ketopantoate reductase